MSQEELEEYSLKCGLNTQEYLDILDIVKTKDADDLSVNNIDLEAEVKTSTSGVKLLTGIPDIDNLTKGLGTGVHVLAGFRKCCKSTLAINLIYRALNEGMNVLLLSLEMSKINVLNTLISLHTFEVDSKAAITRDELSTLYELDRKRYNDYLYSFLSLPGNLTIVTEKDLDKNSTQLGRYTYSARNLNDIFNKVNTSCYKRNQQPVQLLVVDNINCIRSWEGKAGEKAYSDASNFFRKAALSFGDEPNERNYDEVVCGGMPVICLLLCQINRSGGKEAIYNGFYPDSCIAETVNIERDACTIIPIYTNQAYIESNFAMIKLEAARYSKAMLAPVEVPVYLEYGKIGYPIGQVNTDENKKKIEEFQHKYKVVRVRLPNGEEKDILLPIDAPIPEGCVETRRIFMEDEDE